MGSQLGGTVLGVLGLGRIGSRVARVGTAFGMDVITWSTNLTPRVADQSGVTYVSRDELFRRADVLTIHLVLSERTRGLVGAAESGMMKPTALLVNTSRGPIIDEQALLDALRSGRLARGRLRRLRHRAAADGAPAALAGQRGRDPAHRLRRRPRLSDLLR
ncbi:NAD(P)-dependent oxidoreductase [Candidatus Mycobacterium methanotrophicum]|uniref:D-isomer specific 2-hydroxyacid dehydrogenase NAD-binding domain-containing protein n=1 Tax=Candidatus Mycobacterium methanotrophicum TaxID=2943498 RepID=A0ABY4QLA7_9MYCO|nr:NAD(P)-dependent oxidoreductase [Candidatus Mycobacterium methanotrophicum]UQX11773.1 hypothetical protein M5I08_04910 [Candidatus Mycobacterium methanotrophicum]